MSSNWWANKLAQGPQRTGPPPFPRPTVPVGYQGYQPPVQPQYDQRPAYQPPAPPQEQQWQPNETDPTKVAEVLPIWHWQGNPQGGARETATTGNCPACGSVRFFSRSAQAVTNSNTGQVVQPRAECSDCGYPNEQGALGVSAQATGAASPARQGAAPASIPGSRPFR